jgi:transposase
MKQRKSNTKIAGVDVCKPWLDVAVWGSQEVLRMDNTAAGLVELGAWLRAREVSRVGLEATGGYERALVAWLGSEGFEVVVHQPAEVRNFARFKRLKAKNDKIDAQLIAVATAQVDAVKAANDPRLVELAERLTAYEQASDALARHKTTMEHLTLADLKAEAESERRRLTDRKKGLERDLIRRVKAEPELARRYGLLLSLPGVGPLIAAALVVRMPELGVMKRGQAASLLGVAPFDRDSGRYQGKRFIWGGRARPRRLLYLGALAAKRWDPTFRAFAERLIAEGKAPKVAIVAIMRKLIEAANIVLARGQPWQPYPAS